MWQALRDYQIDHFPFHGRNKIKHIIKLVFILCLGFLQIEASSPIMPLEQVKPGMKGIGKSVFLGSTVEEFGVEILGILENVGPKKNIILARLSGKGLENTGLIQGMSGSPVYIDGKLIGAVALSFAFAKEPIVGITPIGEMLAVKEQKRPAPPSTSSFFPVQPSLSLEDLLAIHKDIFSARPSLLSQGQMLRPLDIPLIFSGFSSSAVEKAKQIFAQLGFCPMTSGGAGQAVAEIPPVGQSLREGDPVAVQLIAGDLSMSGVGTVTYVDGNSLLAFGHPLYNLGATDYAMAKAKVLTVVPSLESSFKLAATGAIVGRFVQDRAAGVLGEIGKMPRLVSLIVNLMDSEGKPKEFKLELVEDKLLTPLLVNMSVSSILSSEERAVGNLSCALDGDIYLDNGASVHVEDFFSGNFDTAITNLSGLLTAIVFYLGNNEFEDVGIHRINLNVRAVEEVKFANLERVWLDKYEVAPGERIQVKIYYRTFGGQIYQEAVEIEAPPLPAGSEFYLIIADAAAMHQLETNLYRSQDFVPRNLGQLIRILNSIRKNNRIYFRMMASKPGLFLKGEELPNLPTSMKSMFASPRAAASAPTELTKSTLREYQLPIAYVFRGMATIPVRIKK